MAGRFKHRTARHISRLLAVALAVTVVAVSAPAAERTVSPEFPVASEARVAGDAKQTRFILDLDRKISVSAFALADPYRVVLDIPQVTFRLAKGTGSESRGLIKAFRYGLVMAGGSRIVFDLAGPARIEKVQVLDAVNGQPARLVVEFAAVDRTAFLQALAADAGRSRAAAKTEEAAAGTTASIPDAAPGDTRPVVVIDPGHGGIDPGAVVASIAEKSVVLAFGQKLKEQLEAQGRYRVIMTRADDSFVPLGDRVRIARSVDAHLFISIHADSLTQAQEVRGATIYTGSERASDAEAARLAAKENQADAVAGLDASEDVQDVAGILMDLAKRETRGFSAMFARNLVEKLGGSVKMHKVPLRSAGFRVLTAPDVPSVLIELGYMSSPKDAELLNSESWRAQAVTAVQAAVDQYFERTQAPGKAAESRR